MRLAVAQRSNWPGSPATALIVSAGALSRWPACGGERLPEPVPAAGVDQHDADRRPPGGGQAEQVDSGQRAARAPADDRDDRPVASVRIGEYTASL